MEDKMKAALLYGLRDLRLVDVPVPKVHPRTVLVKVNACGICPTDINKFHTIYSGQIKLPENLGHEFVGTVVEIGPAVQNFELGMRVMGDGFAGYAEYALLELDVEPPVHVPQPLTIPDEVSDYAATFAEPLGCCVHAVMDQAELQADQSVLIIGGGTMGQLMAMVAKSTGARVYLSEPDAWRRSAALSFGADAVIDPQSESLPQAIRELNAGKLVEASILTIGNPSSVQEAMDVVRPCGRVILFGRFPHGAKIEIESTAIYRNEIRIMGSYWAGGAPNCANVKVFQHALDLIATGRAPVERLISSTYSLSQIQQAFDAAARMDTFKIMVVPDDRGDSLAKKQDHSNEVDSQVA